MAPSTDARTRRGPRVWPLILITVIPLVLMAAPPRLSEQATALPYQARVAAVRRVPGLVAFWDFVQREADGARRFLAWRGAGLAPGFPLDAVNYVQTFWGEGRAASYDDVPRLGRGPFGEAVHFGAETDATFRPTLMVPREALHDTGLDVKGPGASVSMVAWAIREAGNHAIAGIWHEGTDLNQPGVGAATRVQAGQRQYALFAGLAANTGAAAVHVSENGRSSFGDRYARNLATTRRLIPTVTRGALPSELDAAWSVVGFVFDNNRDQVTAYLDGEADDYWIDQPEAHPFFQWPARGWLQAQLHAQAGLQEGEDPAFPADQFYSPPERNRRRTAVSETPTERAFDDTFEFTKVRVVEQRSGAGPWRVASRTLRALRVNPYWFGHDLYAPRSATEGGPFTIGRVIHSSRGVGTEEYIGGVAVFNRALTPNQMRELASIGRREGFHGPIDLLRASDRPTGQ